MTNTPGSGDKFFTCGEPTLPTAGLPDLGAGGGGGSLTLRPLREALSYVDLDFS